MSKCAYTILREMSEKKSGIINLLAQLQGQELPEDVKALLQRMFVSPVVNDVHYYEELLGDLKELLEEIGE